MATEIVRFNVTDYTVVDCYVNSTFWSTGMYGADVGFMSYGYKHGVLYENANCVLRCEFTVPNQVVAGSVYFEGWAHAMTQDGHSFGPSDMQTPLQLVCQISTDAMAYRNANGPGGSGRGRETATVQYAYFGGSYVAYINVTFSYPMQLYPGTTYYLWLYPNGTSVPHVISIDSSGYGGIGPIIYAADGAFLDVNGWLDGAYSGNITGYGKCDVYINGSRTATGVTDHYQFYPSGTTYSVQNIVADSHRTYDGVHYGALSGTIGSALSEVVLSFNTKSYTVTARSGTDFVTVSGGGSAKYGSTVTLTATVGSKTGATTSFDGWYNSSGTRVSTSLSYTVTVSGDATYTAKGSYTWNDYYFDLNGWLDGSSSGGIQNFGTCDIYINNVRVAHGVSDHYTKYQYGSSYEVKNIQAIPGHTYVGVHSGSLTGTIGASTTRVVLAFDTAWYTVTFNGNGGTPGWSSKSVKYNTTYGTLPSANMDTCMFLGWFTSPVGGTQILPDTAFTRTSGITLYAQWYCDGSANTYHSGQYRNYYIYIYHNGQWIRYAPYIYKSGSYVLHP